MKTQTKKRGSLWFIKDGDLYTRREETSEASWSCSLPNEIIIAVNAYESNQETIKALVEAAKEMFAVIYNQSMRRTPEKWSKSIDLAEKATEGK